ncbi:hypothetical protein VTL71DRAFT_14940 [Oculimacula yallundae]|uniref:Uncharacterized protein n=1 Tax=Oculimacula yallundae TaxID=86028 RepID=A0ABR4CHD3_9HELO
MLYDQPCKLQPAEVKEILNLQHLVKCTERMCLTSELWGSEDYPPFREDEPREKPPHEMRLWRERFYRAIYRIFIAGPVFYGVHNKPFSSKAKRPPGVPREYLREYDASRDSTLYEPGIPYWNYVLPREASEHLQQFPVYNTSASHDQEKIVFGTFAEWIVDDGRKLAEHNNCPELWHLTSAQISGLWEVMAMLNAYHHLMSDSTNGDGQCGHGRSNPDDENPPTTQTISGPTRQVTVIPFGTFGIEDVSMPANLEDGSELRLIANPASVLRDSHDPILNSDGMPINVDIVSIQDFIFRKSGYPNHSEYHQLPSLDLRMFDFTLREHFGLQFGISAFDDFGCHQPWNVFVNSASIFDGVGSERTQYGFEILGTYKPRTNCNYRDIS